jgi:hypothetical protein
VIQRLIAHAHIHVLGMANVVNVLHITAGVARYRAACFQKMEKERMTGQSRIFTGISKHVLKAGVVLSI